MSKSKGTSVYDLVVSSRTDLAEMVCNIHTYGFIIVQSLENKTVVLFVMLALALCIYIGM